MGRPSELPVGSRYHFHGRARLVLQHRRLRGHRSAGKQHLHDPHRGDLRPCERHLAGVAGGCRGGRADLGANPGLSPAEAETILRQSADDLGAAGEDNEFGAGRVNARKALALAGGTPSPTPSPTVAATSTPVSTATPAPTNTPPPPARRARQARPARRTRRLPRRHLRPRRRPPSRRRPPRRRNSRPTPHRQGRREDPAHQPQPRGDGPGRRPHDGHAELGREGKAPVHRLRRRRSGRADGKRAVARQPRSQPCRQARTRSSSASSQGRRATP